MKILAIETSCDETSIALVENLESKNSVLKCKVLAHETISQINKHIEFGGVYPTLAKREHEKNLVPLLHKVLKDNNFLKERTQKNNLENFGNEIYTKLGANIELIERYPDLKENIFDFFSKYELTEKIDIIAVTNGPGLPPALWVGVNFAKTISILFAEQNQNIPIYPINHLEGHIVGGISQKNEDKVEIPSINYPALCLLISGGHTELVSSTNMGQYEKIGETQDDAVGEAYDKVARMLNLPYPGGPELGRLAELGRNQNLEQLNFPRPMLHSKDLNFSFSGLKTHILYFIQKLEGRLNEEVKIQIATEFEEAVKDVLTTKTIRAISEFGFKSLVVGGGVASNLYLKTNFEKIADDLNVDLYYSVRDLATDNALMIALTCATQIKNNIKPSKDFVALGSKNYQWNSHL